MCGFLLPLASIVLVFMARLEWKADMHPPQLTWWLWSLSLCGTGFILGFGVCAYWFKGGHRQDERGRND